MLTRLERALGVQDRGARRHRDDHLTRERLRGARNLAGAHAFRHESAARFVDVPHERDDLVRDEHAHSFRTVDAAPDHGVRGRLGAAERVRCQHAGGRGAQRRHRGGVEDCE